MNDHSRIAHLKAVGIDPKQEPRHILWQLEVAEREMRHLGPTDWTYDQSLHNGLKLLIEEYRNMNSRRCLRGTDYERDLKT